MARERNMEKAKGAKGSQLETNKKAMNIQVIFRGTFWARQWSLLLKEEDGQKVREGCLILEKRVSGFFAMKGWNLRKRLGD
jgi:hypothetical protein